MSILGGQWQGVGGAFTLSTKPSEGMISRSALAFIVELAETRPLMCAAKLLLGSILGAGRIVFLERAETMYVPAVGADLMVGMLSRMPTGVAMVREKKEKMVVGFMLEFCVLADHLLNRIHRWN